MATDPRKPVLSNDVVAAVKEKLATMDLRTVKKGEIVKLSPQTAAWSVNYTT